jgi:type I restriction enzyme R subunit
MSIHDETEADTRAKRIDPVLKAAGWGVVEGSHIRHELIVPGRIMAGGKKGKSLKCDYVLEYRGHKLAVLEAKRAGISYSEGVGQAKDYAHRVGSRFAFASNGLGWYRIDMTAGTEGTFKPPFPTPDDLWNLTFAEENAWRLRFGAVPFEAAGGKWMPRYYQHKAITAVLEAVAKGDRRILLTLATGTGKTSIAFQIAWKLYHAKWSLTGEPDRRPRILFLADRNILADQAYNAFSAFPKDALTRIDPEALRKKGKVPVNASIFFTIFQTFMTGEDGPVFRRYPPDFFDFIVIDECHRGGANDESQWREVMEHFSPAVQLGLTATPKRKLNADTYDYFGEPVYTYALRDGIEDGFLTPFKVRQMASTIDEYVWDGTDTLLAGEAEEGQVFTEADFNTKIEIRERELSRVKEFMGQIDQREKTLVFCATQAHAALVRDLINQVKTSTDPDYCHRVTANDGEIGEAHLRAFQDNAKTIPTILTTSQKLSTGVDARNVRHIVLMRPIRSMIEFKQIIGRGTRTYEGKDFFTIWDFVKAHEHFNDEEWDGEPLPPEPGEPPGPRPGPGEPYPEPPERPPGAGGEDEPPAKIVIELAKGKARSITYIAATTYWGPDGKPMSATEFLQRLFGDLSSRIPDEDTLRATWSVPEKREHLLEQLAEAGYDAERLDAIRRLVDAPNSDLFDVIAYILFDTPPQSRAERAERLKHDGLDEWEGDMRDLLLGILAAYERAGETELGSKRLRDFLTTRFGGAKQGADRLGGTAAVKEAYRKLQQRLYAN